MQNPGILLALSLSATALHAHADVFKCTDLNGQVSYAAAPCPVDGHKLDIETSYPKTSPGMRASEKNFLHQVESERAMAKEQARQQSAAAAANRNRGGVRTRSCSSFRIFDAVSFDYSHRISGRRLICARFDVAFRRSGGKLRRTVRAIAKERLWARFEGQVHPAKTFGFRFDGPDRVTAANNRYDVEACFGDIVAKNRVIDTLVVGCQ